MKQKVVAPSVGESITEVSILKWHVPNGGAVKVGQVILEIESDKASVEVIAEADGAIEILKPEGSTIPVGEVLAEIDTEKEGTANTSPTAVSSTTASQPAAARPVPTPSAGISAAPAPVVHSNLTESMIGPAAKRTAEEYGIDLRLVPATGKDGRITKGDVLDFIARGGKPMQVFAPAIAPATGAIPATATATTTVTATPAAAPPAPPRSLRPGERREPMSRLRKTIAKRLLSAQQNAAILTTFNEVDMSPVMALRAKHKDAFKAKHGVPLSFMSFFTRACVEALKAFPTVNAFIEGEDIIYHDFQDIGIAVGTDRGLVVPIIRGAEHLDFLGIEKAMGELAIRAREGKLGINEMTGGTFTISNGGVYGSMMSTPILNPPQSAILGMHNIVERAVVRDKQIVIRPMMYLALSYDHRIIDGKEAVTFLVHIKEALENPEEKLNWKGV